MEFLNTPFLHTKLRHFLGGISNLVFSSKTVVCAKFTLKPFISRLYFMPIITILIIFFLLFAKCGGRSSALEPCRHTETRGVNGDNVLCKLLQLTSARKRFKERTRQNG